MKKFTLLTLFSLIFLNSCITVENPKSLGYLITGITEKNDKYEVSLTVFRPDLYLKEAPFQQSKSDTPAPLALSELTLNSIPCDLEAVPHKCEISDLKAKSILTATFKDATLTTEILLPEFIYKLETPEIVAPQDTVEDKSVLEFIETKADNYEITLRACYSENSCLDNVYNLQKVDNIWKITNDTELNYSATVQYMGNTLSLDFEFEPQTYKTITYEVIANKVWPSLPNIELNSQKTVSKSFTF